MNKLYISDDVLELSEKVEKHLAPLFRKCDQICFNNSKKVLDAFIKNEVSANDFCGTNGYGYNDIGREKIDRIFSEVLGAEDALVRSQFVSGSHALTVCLFALLRPGDTMLSITGTPYDTLLEVIGIRENDSSLKSFGIDYEQVDLINNCDFDYKKIEEVLNSKKIKLIEIQRSKGYSSRKSITTSQIKEVVKLIRKIDKDVIIMVDNCYCEFVEEVTPLEVGADIMVGSLIKNLGAGVVPNGGYIAGKKELVYLASERLAVPGEGKDVGATIDMNRCFLQGIYMAPSVVNASVKTAIFAGKMLEELGFKTMPRWDEERADIVQAIIFDDPDKMIKYCCGIQMASPIDSYVKPIPDDMPGYGDKIIMAAGSFVQGSTIELSCDGPLRKPYIAYQQGGLTYEYGKLGVLKAITEIRK
ncbi:MAG: aminotransferase class I/II-fold pyridoxal phosphate-dependent enzyme [Bacilli bacterium]